MTSERIPGSPDYQRLIRESFATQGLMSTFKARLEDVSPGAVEISAPLTRDVSQQHGFGHAGLTFALGDSAAGYAALSLMESTHEVLTTEMKINLLAPAQGQRLLARGSVIKPGRRLMVVTAQVFAEDEDGETLIALLQGTMLPVPRAD